jgi:hypothetical protein
LAAGVGVVHAVDTVLRDEEHVRVDLDRTEGGGCVGGHERVAGAGGEDDDAVLLQVADGTPPDVRLGDLLDRDGGLHAYVNRRARWRPATRGR